MIYALANRSSRIRMPLKHPQRCDFIVNLILCQYRLSVGVAVESSSRTICRREISLFSAQYHVNANNNSRSWLLLNRRSHSLSRERITDRLNHSSANLLLSINSHSLTCSVLCTRRSNDSVRRWENYQVWGRASGAFSIKAKASEQLRHSFKVILRRPSCVFDLKKVILQKRRRLFFVVDTHIYYFVCWTYLYFLVFTYILSVLSIRPREIIKSKRSRGHEVFSNSGCLCCGSRRCR